MRENYRDRAVVIRSYDFGEADRVIVLLTQNHGLVRAVAKGVRRAKSALVRGCSSSSIWTSSCMWGRTWPRFPKRIR